MIRLIIMILAFSPTILSAQNVNDELVRINRVLFGKEDLVLKMDYSFFDSLLAKTPSEQASSLIAWRLNSRFTKSFGVEQLIENGISITINHNRKIVLVDSIQDATNFQLESMLSIIPSIVDSSVKSFESALFEGENEHTIELTNIHGMGGVKKVTIIYESESYLLNKAIIEYAEQISQNGSKAPGPVIQIDYSYPSSSFKSRQIGDYIEIVDENEILINAKYKSYQLINGISE